MTFMPVANPTGNPLGKYGAITATLIALSVVGTALAVHIAEAFGFTNSTDPFIDSAALLVIGVVLGASALGGTAQAAHDAALAANRRLDAINAPNAPTDGKS